jgi:NADPH:quinone reductase-like Zn-dependent oxidoreductase
VTVHGIETGSQEMYDELAAFIDEHRLVPLLDSVHPVENIHDAVRHLESGGHFGKIVVSVGGAQV